MLVSIKNPGSIYDGRVAMVREQRQDGSAVVDIIASSGKQVCVMLPSIALHKMPDWSAGPREYGVLEIQSPTVVLHQRWATLMTRGEAELVAARFNDNVDGSQFAIYKVEMPSVN